MFDLSNEEFKYISNKVYNYAKINLSEKKRTLVVSRLSKRIKKLNLNSFEEYIGLLKNRDPNGEEFQLMIDSLSTNYSLFFREPHHFEFMDKEVLPKYTNKELNIWSAASSTGQEVYSIIITIKEYELKTGNRIKPKLYASDINRDVLKKASEGIFEASDVSSIPQHILKKYFLKGNGANSNSVKVKNELKQFIKFYKINLDDKSYDLPLMDIIFLRNVIIYFDQGTKIELINRLHSYIKPGGYLIIGHSESLSSISDKFEFVGKSIYKRIG